MTRPRKRFGQHFLRDQGIIQAILAALAPRAHDHLVEIGPGQGALTLPLLEQIKNEPSIDLDVIELDRDLASSLKQRTAELAHFKVHTADVLRINFNEIKTDDRLLHIFGNLPYNISTPLIFHLLKNAALISEMLFMVQKEVADRMAAQVSTPAYGRLSVMVQYHCAVETLFDVSPHAFYPPPRVESSVIRLHPHRVYPYQAGDEALFAAIVKQAFEQRRKTLRNSLKNLCSETVWGETGIAPTLRAENLTVKDFVAISNVAAKSR